MTWRRPGNPRAVTVPESVQQSFAIDPSYRGVLRLFGVATAKDAFVDLDDETFTVRFGFWVMRTPVANLAGAEVAGPFSALKVIGVHLSFADRGITFGSNAESGVCVRFHHPVPGIEPLGVLRHPGVTVTVDDPGALAHAVVQCSIAGEAS